MPNTDDEPQWLQLLRSLSDEELERYGEIAADQRRLEWRHGWAQILCLAGAVLALAWFVRDLMMDGLNWSGSVALGIAAALAYWPYRKWLVRRLWGRHVKAVAREETLRRQGRPEN